MSSMRGSNQAKRYARWCHPVLLSNRHESLLARGVIAKFEFGMIA